jgi:hypothetical protein
MSEATTDLKLIALDGEDLAVISAHVQDALVRRADIAYLSSKKRFALAAWRYDWTVSATAGRKERVGAALRFDRVLKVSQIGLSGLQAEAPLNLLAIRFEEHDPPAGIVVLTFSGGAAIRLDVECLEAELRDLGPRREVAVCPGHALVDDEPETG